MYNILIVDDEPAVLKGLKDAVKWEEYGLEIAGWTIDSAEALEIAKNKKIHVLLTDIKMPGMSGIELIKQIKQEGMDTKFIILSGYDDFNYVKEAIKLGVENYLLKPLNIDELSSTLSNTINKIQSYLHNYTHKIEDYNIFRENILYRWVTNTISSEELVERVPLLNINYKSRQFMVVVIKMQDDSLNGKNISISSILNICSEIICRSKSAVVFHDIANDIILLFSGDNLGSEKSEIMQLINECMEKINTILRVSVFITIGSVECVYRNVYKSYSAAKDLQVYCLLMPSNSIVDYDKVRHTPESGQEYIDINFEAFNNLIAIKKREESVQFIESIFLQIASGDMPAPDSVRNIVMEILFNILNTVKKAAKNLDDIPCGLRNMFSYIDTIKTCDKLVEWLKLTVNKAIDYLNMKEDKSSPLIKQILYYIHSNYNKDISLKLLSYDFNVNASYLGQLFKNETGEMFTNYLNDIRIEKAKELLSNKNLKVNEIMERVGYVNESYFFRMFKRITGVSPVEYKEICVNKDRFEAV